MTIPWILWHRLRGHWVVRNGWTVFRHRSTKVWRCITCRSWREGMAPNFLEWKERG